MEALRQYKQLPNTFVYIFAFFLLADVRSSCYFMRCGNQNICGQGLNTTGMLIAICQNDRFSFSFLQNTYLGLAQAITSALSTFGFWYVQKHWRIGTKTMVRSDVQAPLEMLMTHAVRCHKHCDGADSIVGNDWDLDGPLRVNIVFLLIMEGGVH